MGQSTPFPRKVVLVVEDEPLIRMQAVDVLEEAGFEAIEAGSADEAVRILESRTDISVVFTDVDMPGSMNGLRFAAVVRDRWPPVQIIVTSGLVKVDQTTLPEGTVFFSKPYDTEKLVRQMHLMT